MGRTLRALRQAGIVAEDVCGRAPPALGEAISAVAGPVWLVRAGTWPARSVPIQFPLPSAMGRPLCALGAVLPEAGMAPSADGEVLQWAALQAETGGDFSAAPDLSGRLPPVASVYLEAEPSAALARRLSQGEPLSQAIATEFDGGRFRVVRFASLDVHDDLALRVMQVVTTLQQGGAERVALDLANGLGSRGVRSLLVTLGKPTRASFPVPAGLVDLSDTVRDRRARAGAVACVAQSFRADLVHGHLLDGADVARLAAAGLPLLLTIHNTRPGWPREIGRASCRERVYVLV